MIRYFHILLVYYWSPRIFRFILNFRKIYYHYPFAYWSFIKILKIIPHFLTEIHCLNRFFCYHSFSTLSPFAANFIFIFYSFTIIIIVEQFIHDLGRYLPRKCEFFECFIRILFLLLTSPLSPIQNKIEAFHWWKRQVCLAYRQAGQCPLGIVDGTPNWAQTFCTAAQEREQQRVPDAKKKGAYLYESPALGRVRIPTLDMV